VPSPGDAAASLSRVPGGSVRLAGVLQPDEAPAHDAASDSTTDGETRGATDGETHGATDGATGTAVVPRLVVLDAAELVNLWGAPIYNGFLVLTGEQAAGPVTGQPERVPAPQPQPSGLAWRNLAYALQWWLFAAFALVLWWKMVQQDAEERAAAAAAPLEGRVGEPAEPPVEAPVEATVERRGTA
jgi:surfeit locus 1 family protein